MRRCRDPEAGATVVSAELEQTGYEEAFIGAYGDVSSLWFYSA